MANPAQTFQNAISHHQAGRFPDAEKDYLSVIATNQKHLDALRLLGGLYLQTSRPERAEELLVRALAACPNDAEILNNLGLALRNQGKLAEATAHYEQAVQSNPSYFQAANNLGSIYLESGRPDQAVRLLTQSLHLNPNNPQAHYNLGNAFREQGRFPEAAACYEQALRLKPGYADAVTNLGLALGEMGRLEEARQKHEQALQMVPNNIHAMNNLGNVLREMGRTEEALASYQCALQTKPDYDIGYINIGTAYRDLGKHDLAALQYDKALGMNPNSADALINYGTLMLDLNRHEEAIAYYDHALKIRPSSPDAKWSKALSLLALGQYAEGWELHESGLGHKRGRGRVPYTLPKWQGENFTGKKLLIWSEQGLGDSLQFIRYARLCKERGGTVTACCPAALARLFANDPAIDHVVTAANENDYDFQISLMSLPQIFGTTLDTVPADLPYLFIDAESRAKWAPRFAGDKKFKVGLVWAGSPREHQPNAHLIDKRRSTNLELMKPLLDFDQASFYNLQIGKARDQVAALGLQDRIIDYAPDIRDFLDTAALVENLDLVISVDTSVAHLAGGLGVPVWILSRFDACWRWLRNREINPWYSTARIFGQPAPGEWQPVAEKIRAALADEINKQGASS